MSNAVILIVLLPTAAGGLRPIGLLPFETRLWMRTRAQVVRSWEAATALPCLFGARGMGAQRAAWVAAFKAEAIRNGGTTHVMALLDLTKAFETVRHDLLIDAARRRGYNLTIIRLSLAAYRMARVVGVDGVYTQLMFATRGITAGSGYATSELRLLMLDLINDLPDKWGDQVDMTLYVDDLSVSVSGDPIEAARRCAVVLDFIAAKLELDLGMMVAPKKSFVLSSRPAAAALVTKMTTTAKVKPVLKAKALGVATTAGRARSVIVFNKRIATFVAMKERYQQLRAMGVRTDRMTQSTAAASMLYGVDGIGVADTMLDHVRRAAAAAAAPGAGGKNADSVFHASFGAAGTADPAFNAHVLPIKQ